MYPDVNGDGTRVVFESDSTNADLNYSGGGSQIYLWALDQNSSGSGFVRVLTEGNGESYNPSIDDLGQRVVFHSFANNLVGVGKDTNNLSDAFIIQLESPAAYNNADYFEIKAYQDKNGNLFNQATFLVKPKLQGRTSSKWEVIQYKRQKFRVTEKGSFLNPRQPTWFPGLGSRSLK